MDDELTARAELERRVQGTDGSDAAFVLRGVGSTGRVSWIVTALAPQGGLRIVHLAVPHHAGRMRAAGLDPLLDQLESVTPEGGDAIVALRHRIDADPGLADERWPERFATLVAQMNPTPPVLIAIDDAHHLGDGAIAAVAAISRGCDPCAVTLVLGVPAAGDPRIKALALPILDAARLRLPALVELGQRRAGRRMAPTVAEAILGHVGDEPSVALETVAQLDDAQLAGWTALPLPLPGPPTRSSPFETLADVTQEALLLAALAHRPGRHVLTCAFALEGLGAAPLDAAEATGLLRVEETIRFADPLDRSVVVATASAPRRRRAHARLALAFEEVAPGDLRARVHHLVASTTAAPDHLLPMLRQLCELEEEEARPLDAARGWVQIAHVGTVPAERDGALGRAAALARAAGVAAWGDHLMDAGHGRGPRHLPPEADGPLSVLHRLTGAGVQLAEQAPGPAARLYATAAIMALFAGELPMAERAAELGTALAPEGTTDAAWAGTARCVVESLTGRGEEVEARLGRHLAAFPSPREDPDAALMRASGNLARIWLGDVDTARVDLRTLTTELDSVGHVGHLPFALACLSAADHRRGWWDAATEHADRARELSARTEQPLSGGYAAITLASIAAARGEQDRCRDLLDELTATAATAGAEPMAQYAAAAEGRLALGLGAPDVAVARLEAADEEATRRGIGRVTVLGCVGDLLLAYLESDQPEQAEQLVQRLEDEAQRGGSPWVGAMALRGKALLGPHEEAATQLADSARLFGLAIDPFEQARDRLLAATIALRNGDAASARAPARLARVTFASLRATPWVVRADRILEGADRTGATVRLTALTSQERHVTELVAEGASNREVAAAMVLSHKTVEYHLHNIYRRLGISSRGELVDLVREAARLNGDGPRTPLTGI